MFRTRTIRYNVRYQIMIDFSRKQQKQNEFVMRIMQQKARRWFHEKLIVYCNNVQKNQKLTKLLNCPVYHHNATKKSKKLQQFIYDDIQIIVAINSLKLNLNVLNIRAIIHVDRSRNLMNYIQKNKRAKRDNLFNEIIIVQTIEWSSHSKFNEINFEQLLIIRLIKKKSKKRRCRRVMLNEYINEMKNRIMCENDETKCDICRDSTKKKKTKKKRAKWKMKKKKKNRIREKKNREYCLVESFDDEYRENRGIFNKRNNLWNEKKFDKKKCERKRRKWKNGANIFSSTIITNEYSTTKTNASELKKIRNRKIARIVATMTKSIFDMFLNEKNRSTRIDKMWTKK